MTNLTMLVLLVKRLISPCQSSLSNDQSHHASSSCFVSEVNHFILVPLVAEVNLGMLVLLVAEFDLRPLTNPYEYLIILVSTSCTDISLAILLPLLFAVFCLIMQVSPCYRVSSNQASFSLLPSFISSSQFLLGTKSHVMLVQQQLPFLILQVPCIRYCRSPMQLLFPMSSVHVYDLLVIMYVTPGCCLHAILILKKNTCNFFSSVLC